MFLVDICGLQIFVAVKKFMFVRLYHLIMSHLICQENVRICPLNQFHIGKEFIYFINNNIVAENYPG